jgi:hypothetical protein
MDFIMTFITMLMLFGGITYLCPVYVSGSRKNKKNNFQSHTNCLAQIKYLYELMLWIYSGETYIKYIYKLYQ